MIVHDEHLKTFVPALLMREGWRVYRWPYGEVEDSAVVVLVNTTIIGGLKV